MTKNNNADKTKLSQAHNSFAFAIHELRTHIHAYLNIFMFSSLFRHSYYIWFIVVVARHPSWYGTFFLCYFYFLKVFSNKNVCVYDYNSYLWWRHQTSSELSSLKRINWIFYCYGAQREICDTNLQHLMI